MIDDCKFTIKDYTKIFNYYCITDCRETNFQNRIAIPFLQGLMCKFSIDIVDCSTQYRNKNTVKHDRSKYAGDYTPDLLIAKNWNYNNRDNNSIEYLALIEVKSPIIDPINKSNPHTDDEIHCYLNKNNKVILTDCRRWYFYKKNKDTQIVNVYKFDLYSDDNCKIQPCPYKLKKLPKFIKDFLKLSE